MPTQRRRTGEPPAVGGRVGDYTIVERIGAGGLAELFKATPARPQGRSVALKCARRRASAGRRRTDSLAAEAEVLSEVRHPNVIRLLDVTEAPGTRALVLEYLDGPSVAQMLALLGRPKIPIPVAVCAYVAREVCRALEAAHAAGFVHRDVSPENIMTTSAGAVKLVDFGIAVRRGTGGGVRRRGVAIHGKPAYMAPEQILDCELDGRADVFALGAVLYEMLTLRRLFGASDDVATVQRVFNLEIEPPSRVHAAVPPEIDAIVLRALERAPDRRYASAAEMGRDLDAFLAGKDVGRTEMAAFAQMYRRIVNAERSSPARMAA